MVKWYKGFPGCFFYERCAIMARQMHVVPTGCIALLRRDNWKSLCRRHWISLSDEVTGLRNEKWPSRLRFAKAVESWANSCTKYLLLAVTMAGTMLLVSDVMTTTRPFRVNATFRTEVLPCTPRSHEP